MGEERVVKRTRVRIDGADYELSPDEDVNDLQRRIEAAVDSPGRFVGFRTITGSIVSALVTPRTRLALHASTAVFELWDSDADGSGYPGDFDY